MEVIREASQSPFMSTPSERTSVAVVMPVFPRVPTIRPSLASLRSQTRPPDLVVLLDDGSNPDIKTLPDEISGLPVEVIKLEKMPLPAAINSVVKKLERTDFISFLMAGDLYAPTRIEKCLAAMDAPENPRPPAVVVTGVETVGSRGNPLPPEDPRARYFARLWEPGRSGASMADWLGAGNFAGPASNIFARRSYLEANTLRGVTTTFAYGLAILTGLQGLLAVVDAPLLQHCPALPEREPSSKTVAESLLVSMAVLAQLKEKLAVSPETRRNFAAFTRAAWNNLSGLRADLFQQVVLRLAAAGPAEDAQAAADEILRAHDARKAPAHWHPLLDGANPLDLAAYTAALRVAREEVKEARDESRRLRPIAEAAQNSGWVRFGAWLGERSARRIMEMEEASEPTGPEPEAIEPAQDTGETGGKSARPNPGQ